MRRDFLTNYVRRRVVGLVGQYMDEHNLDFRTSEFSRAATVSPNSVAGQAEEMRNPNFGEYKKLREYVMDRFCALIPFDTWMELAYEGIRRGMVKRPSKVENYLLAPLDGLVASLI